MALTLEIHVYVIIKKRSFTKLMSENHCLF
jgi:hypothetical protein